jgi:hypothetical protein
MVEILRLRKAKRNVGGVGFRDGEIGAVRGWGEEEEGNGNGEGVGEGDGDGIVERAVEGVVRRFAPQIGIAGGGGDVVDRHM